MPTPDVALAARAVADVASLPRLLAISRVIACYDSRVALFDEAEEHQAYSANVAYELGIMHSHNKDCLILRHSSLPEMPFDLIKDLHLRYEKDLAVRSMITAWIRQVNIGGGSEPARNRA